MDVEASAYVLRAVDGFSVVVPAMSKVYVGRNTVRGLDERISRIHMLIDNTGEHLTMTPLGKLHPIVRPTNKGSSGDSKKIKLNIGDNIALIPNPSPGHIFTVVRLQGETEKKRGKRAVLEIKKREKLTCLPDGFWSCPLCSLINDCDSTVCHACLSQRPESTLPEWSWICSVCLALHPSKKRDMPSCTICKCPNPGFLPSKRTQALEEELSDTDGLTDGEIAQLLYEKEKKLYSQQFSTSSSLTETDKKRQQFLRDQAKALLAQRRRQQNNDEISISLADPGSSGGKSRKHKGISSESLDPLGNNVPFYNPREIWQKYLKSKGGTTMGGKKGSDTKVKFLPLIQSSEEYKEVVGFFRKTCRKIILKVEAVKSPIRLGYYNFKKQLFHQILGSKRLNERWVWHGTAAETIQMIAHQGFLRQFMVESHVGKGVCFSSNATAAAERSEADRLRERRMFLCRAIVGSYHEGYKGCILPDVKPGKRFEVHESVVDSIRKPTFFVLFQDDQAYPEYCITFKDEEIEEKEEKGLEGAEHSTTTDPI